MTANVETGPSLDVRDELKRLWTLSLPLSLATAGQALMGVVDTAVTGRAGALAQGAVGLGNSIYFAIAALGMGVMMGLDPLIAQAFGAGEPERAKRHVGQGLWLGLFLGGGLCLPLAALTVVTSLNLAGAAQEVGAETARYLWCRLPGLPLLLWFIGARAYLQGAGAPRALLISTVLANVVNFVADVWFVFGGAGLPAMGGAGAGLATTLCTLFQLLWIAKAVRDEGAWRHWPRPDVDELKAALRVGVPIGFQMGAEVGVFALAAYLAGRLGKESLAAHQVALTLGSLSFCVAVGVANAASVRVSWAIGAHDTAAARRSGLTAFGLASAVMSVFAALFFLLPGPLASALTRPPEVLELAIPLFVALATFQLSDGIQAVGAGVLRGAGDTRAAMLANALGHYLIGFPAAVWMGLHLKWGIRGIWWGLCLGLTAVGASLLVRFLWLTARPVQRLER